MQAKNHKKKSKYCQTPTKASRKEQEIDCVLDFLYTKNIGIYYHMGRIEGVGDVIYASMI